MEYSDNGIITGINDKRIVKLFSNGTIQKREGNSYVSAYENENDDQGIYILYKDLGNKEYNYDKNIMKIINLGRPVPIWGVIIIIIMVK